MGCRYADPTLIEALVAGRLKPDEAEAMRAHLNTHCADCETLFSTIDEGRLYDQIVQAHDRATGFVPLTAAETRTGLDRIAQRTKDQPSRRIPMWAVPVLGVAAVAVLLVLVRPMPQGNWGVKGDAALVLTLQQGQWQDGQLEVSGELPPEGEVRAGMALLFYCSVTREGTLRLFHVNADGVQTDLWPAGLRLERGRQRLKAGGNVLTFDTTGLSGAQVIEARFESPGAAVVPSRAAFTVIP